MVKLPKLDTLGAGGKEVRVYQTKRCTIFGGQDLLG